MKNKKIDKDQKLVDSLKGLAQAYEQISVTKMQRVRGRVLSSREYLAHLSEVFENVKSNYQDEIEKYMLKKKTFFSFSPMGGNKKSLAILISSNNKLYGDIGRKVFTKFWQDFKQNNPDIFIVGKVGKELFDYNKTQKSYRYIDFPESKEDESNLQEFFKEISNYETVNVYHGEFVNVLTQMPLVSNISGSNFLTSESKSDEKVKFFFEPSISTVLKFFEDQVISALFRQTLHESELSHVASRIRQMESALQNIGDYEKKLLRIKRREHKRVEDSKQIQRVSGMRLWR